MAHELIQASPLQTTFASGTAAWATLSFEDSGVARLRDLVVQASTNDVDLGGTDISVADFTKALRVESILFNGKEMLKARNTPSVPAGMFAADRQANMVALPDIRFKSGDTLKVKLNVTRTNMGTLNVSIGVPAQLDDMVGAVDSVILEGRVEIIAGSPATALTADGTEASLTCTFDCKGHVDLDRLWIHAVATVGEDVAADDFDAASAIDVPMHVTSIKLRSKRNLIAGETDATLGAPNSPNFWAIDRQRNRVHLGIFEVEPGSTLVIKVKAHTTTLLNGLASFGVPVQIESNLSSL
jgi:hypothetical protein